MGRKATDNATILGRKAGKAAASWFFDGNTTAATLAMVRRGIDEGDPMVMDMFKIPDLSGEWADGLTPHGLMNMVYADPSRYRDTEDEVCRAWESGSVDGYMDEIERALRANGYPPKTT